MLPVLFAMLAGMITGYLLRHHSRLFTILDPLTAWIIRLLLFLLGLGIGRDEALLRQVPGLGLKGFILAVASILGSIAAARILVGKPDGPAQHSADSDGATGPVPGRWAAVRGSLAATAAFSLGLPIGYAVRAMNPLPVDAAALTLYVLMFLVGLGAGADPTALSMIRRHGRRLVLLPVSVVIGTAAGCLGAALVWPELPVRESLAVGAGFGYYSLSSLVIKELSGGDWAAVALLSNISREILTLLAAPLLVRAAGPAAVPAAGGATSMDTTLGATLQSSGREWAVPALFSGIVLTILVPFAVTAILTF
jgi:uncharacterized membrane protein YbjE (DUF340 family)